MALQELDFNTFAKQLRDCLRRLDDYAYLRDHPLVHLLAQEASDARRVEKFRQIILEAIGQLRHVSDPSPPTSAVRWYDLLMLHYVQRQDRHHVMFKLAISERQFYRDLQKASHHLAELLWTRLKNQARSVSTGPTPGISLESEVQRLRATENQSAISLKDLLQKAIASIDTLATLYRVRITLVDAPDQLIPGSYSILRQTIILILAEVMPVFTAGGTLALSWQVVAHNLYIHFTLNGELNSLSAGTGLEARLNDHPSLKVLLHENEAQVSVPSTVHHGVDNLVDILEVRLELRIK